MVESVRPGVGFCLGDRIRLCGFYGTVANIQIEVHLDPVTLINGTMNTSRVLLVGDTPDLLLVGRPEANASTQPTEAKP
jgi:hypothetical protein